jgi:RNA polymerase sigma factor (sigma-70 family)
MVDATAPLPPFERFYLAHRDEILRYLRRLLGPRAEDAWQETFLRALRAYDRLEHGEHLRAWAFTIATRVALDEHRADSRDRDRLAAVAGEADLASELERPAFRELEHLTSDLPPTERAAVVLRYGYDLPYAQIADALGSSEEAARAAASSGVRRLRRSHERLA